MLTMSQAGLTYSYWHLALLLCPFLLDEKLAALFPASLLACVWMHLMLNLGR